MNIQGVINTFRDWALEHDNATAHTAGAN